MYLTPIGGLAAVEPSLTDLAAMGYQLVVDGQTPLLTMYETLAATYRSLARDGLAIADRPMSDWAEVQARAAPHRSASTRCSPSSGRPSTSTDGQRSLGAGPGRRAREPRRRRRRS